MPKPVDTIDQSGRKKRVLIPDDAPDEHADMGIPVSIDLIPLYPDNPAFAHALEKALWERGLITPENFTQGGCESLVRSALQSVLKNDIYDIVRYVTTGELPSWA